MKSSVYIETTVVSYYCAKPSRDLIVAAHQQSTIEWWEKALPDFKAYISPFVVAEIRKGDPKAAALRQEAVDSFAILEINKEINDLAEEYFSRTRIPEKARFDTAHLAAAVYHGMDYIVTWNFEHLLNPLNVKVVQAANNSRGIQTPLICTPEELMEG